MRLDSGHWDIGRREYVQHLPRRLKGRQCAVWDMDEMAVLRAAILENEETLRMEVSQSEAKLRRIIPTLDHLPSICYVKDKVTSYLFKLHS